MQSIMNKLCIGVFTLFLAAGVMYGCSSNNDAADKTATETATEAATETATETATEEVQMQYMTPAELQEKMDADDSNLLIVDVRQTTDYDEGHIAGAISADMDAAKDGDLAAGEDTMKAALEKATGSDTGGDKTIVLVCYSGNAYAKAGTEVLKNIGADMDNVYTLEGGMKAWNEDYPDTLVTE